MAGSDELMLKARSGDPESLRVLLLRHQRNLRLFAAAFLPLISDVDRVVRAVSLAAARTIKDAPDDEALPGWLRAQARTLIAAELARMAGDATIQRDPLVHQLVTAGGERLASQRDDADPEPHLRKRLQMMPKGALDLLVQRFGQGLTLDQLAEKRGLGAEDLAIALQTSCRQLDWTADAFGGAGLDAAHYRVLDAVLSGDADADGDGLRRQVADDPGLAMRAGRDARTHLIAAAWHLPDIALDARDLAPGTRRITNTRQFPSPGAGNPAAKPASSPARRAAPSRRNLPATASGSDRQAERSERSSRTVTLVSLIGAGALVLIGVVALIMRSSASTPVRPLPAPATATAPPATQVLPPAPPTTSTTPVPAVTPAGAPAKESDRNALFGSGSDALPAPVVAYGVRRLVSGYSGPLLRVRRAGDNVERDITATSTGGLDTASLILFVGKADGHVATWYDQSGTGNHLTQPAPDTQPLIARNGALEIENGRPVITFDRTKFQHLSTPAAVQAGTLFALVRTAGPSSGAQGIIGSRAEGKGNEVDAYYPIVDRDRNGKGEWWIGQRDKFDKVDFPMPAKRLVLWASATDGANQPTISLHLDGAPIGSKRLQRPGIPAIGPTVVGCLYWHQQLVDPFSGSLGELIMLPPAISQEAHAAITTNLKTWWRLP